MWKLGSQQMDNVRTWQTGHRSHLFSAITPLSGSQHINIHPDGSIFNVVWLACPIQPIGGLQVILNTESDCPDSSSLETGFT